MKRIHFIFVGIIAISVGSCIKPEVIPAPEPMVDLEASFIGDIGGQVTEFTEFVSGYEGVSDIAIQSSGGTSNAQYTFALMSDQSRAMVRIGLGSISWSSSLGTYRPELNLFNDFFKNNDSPNYSNNALSGFEVVYRTHNDSIFVSRDNSVYGQIASFVPSSIIQGSDSSGDYSKFICNFNCYVYNDWVDMTLGPPGVPMTDSILIKNVTYKGWFKR